ncbi:MAG: hypothetical protein ABR575_07440 [Actinomycetota bacterium]
MKFHIENGTEVGTAEWRGPGQVRLDVPDEHQRAWFERYFTSERATLRGSVDCPEMDTELPSSSPDTFERAANHLAAHAYTVVRVDGGAPGGAPPPGSSA